MPILKNEKHEAFAQKVARGRKAATSYAEIYDVDSKLPQTRSSASELRSLPNVRARIEELQEEAAVDARASTAKVLRELAAIAFADLSPLYDAAGSVKPVKEWPKKLRRAIASVEVDDILQNGMRIGFTTKVKLWDKTKALDMIAKHIKFYPPKEMSHKLEKSLEELIAGSREGEKKT